MEIAYWIVAGLLAVFYLYSGGIKLTRSQEQLAPMMKWAGTTLSMPSVRAIGTLEVLAAIGLIVPPIVDVLPWLAIVAASGLTALQFFAGAFHISRGETKDVGLNVGLFLLSALAIWLGTSVV
jgi:hypothetical protein